MPLTIRVHRIAEFSLLQWARSLSTDPVEAFALAELYYTTIEQELRRTNARPPRSFRIPRIEPETRAWDFQAQRYWVVYVIRTESKRRGFIARLFKRPRTEEVVILGFQDRAPTRDDLERLTTATSRRA
jgi:hypothetical protein